MNTKGKPKISESLDMYSINYLMYIIIIDATSIQDSGRGMVRYMLPNVKYLRIRKIFKELIDSALFKSNYESLKSVNSRFSGNSVIKELSKVLYKLATIDPANSDEELSIDKREKNMSTIIKKMGSYILGKLTSTDKELMQKMVSELNSVAKKIYNTINENMIRQIDSTTINPQPPGKESNVTNERMKNKLKRKLKEMTRNIIISRKLK